MRRYVTKRLGAAARANAAQPPTPPPPSAKRLSFEWVHAVALGLDLADEFAGLIRQRSGGDLTAWLARCEASDCPELRQFASRVRGDEAAVAGVVRERWSNGPVEGHVKRLKVIKRQMFARAGFALLRARVLRAG